MSRQHCYLSLVLFCGVISLFIVRHLVFHSHILSDLAYEMVFALEDTGNEGGVLLETRLLKQKTNKEHDAMHSQIPQITTSTDLA